MNARTDAERDDDAAEGTQSGRWLISYADLITTLMVLFLALYVLQLAKFNALDARERTRARLDDAAARTAEPQAPARVPAWVAQLEALKAGGRISLVQAPHGIEIGIDAGILFHVGDAHLLPDALPVLERIAQALGPHATGDILVEGHTDSVPIANAKYESNWELSSARAGAVVRYLAERGIAPHRLAAVGRADTQPLVAGDDASSRARNRRVTIFVAY
ncbi:OmpA/MotB family protein [Burkholderia multivorans]|uniref:OmpA/MotB family protein n=1 Tax=Burkholderia multivorans TaxID=87883 RepID=UPI0004F78BD9|nr:OmpA family protein [Burkholderia multivorans]AIO73820.1 membrane MotB of proton-channel complex MotA/MotB family protein [Burkholderia multivorans]AOK64386.1 motility protein B [Burkholderia multivorans]KVZ74401.1 motility protein B [Burkholderia multivorans]MBU9387249.1 OmpA family protein [Burkholderia multivorans]MBY4796183.1 OmpA family protein [Burkholderia multivorans]